jgi:hypoxanthine phosphoribosyltransferase
MLEKKRTIFKWGEFRAHSGSILPFKIDCDTLNRADIACIANYIASKNSFNVAKGIPRGGVQLAKALEKYADIKKTPFTVLIVDDVLTTGTSMEQEKAKLAQLVHPEDVVGWVIFARANPPEWINAVFIMTESETYEVQHEWTKQ